MKKLLSRHLPLLLITLFFTCQNDDDAKLDTSIVSPEQKSITKIVSKDDIPDVMSFIASKSNRNLEFTIDNSNAPQGITRNHEDNLILTNAITEQIKQVTNGFGKSNYTFKLIEEGGKTGIYFLNLIVKEYKDTFYLYIVKYVPDSSWLKDSKGNFDATTFSGTLYFYNVEGLFVARSEMTNGYSATASLRNPCNGNNNNGGGGGGNDISDVWGDYGDGNGNDSGTGGNGGGINITCGCAPEHSENQIMTGGCACDTIEINVDKSSDNYTTDKDIEYTLRNPCPPDNNTDCAGTTDCQYGWEEDCSCSPEPLDNDENDEVGIVLDMPNIELYEDFIDTLPQDHQNWLRHPNNEALYYNILNFYRANGFSEENENLATEIIVAGKYGSLVSAFPFVKYPVELAEQYMEDYSVLTNYLMNELPNLANDQLIVTALQEYGSLTQEQIEDALQWDQGPIIRIIDMPCCWGAYGPQFGYDSNTLLISTELANELQNNSTISEDALDFFVGIVILHEFTHLGDYIYNGNMYDGEEGDAFELYVTGTQQQDPNDANAVYQGYLLKRQN